MNKENPAFDAWETSFIGGLWALLGFAGHQQMTPLSTGWYSFGKIAVKVTPGTADPDQVVIRCIETSAASGAMAAGGIVETARLREDPLDAVDRFVTLIQHLL